MRLSVVSSDLLDANEPYIGHQCNCTCRGTASGIARTIFRKFPHADTYKTRREPATPGTFSVHGDGRDHRYVVNLYAQYFPGRPRREGDTGDLRLDWLLHSLAGFVTERQPERLALPFGIGCGLAGGDWPRWLQNLRCFAEHKRTEIILYKLLF